MDTQVRAATKSLIRKLIGQANIYLGRAQQNCVAACISRWFSWVCTAIVVGMWVMDWPATPVWVVVALQVVLIIQHRWTLKKAGVFCKLAERKILAAELLSKRILGRGLNP